jgi:hypothetical protein
MLHKYLQRRGSIYYFRWRIPADLRPILGVTELKHSLRTADLLVAGARAGRYIGNNLAERLYAVKTPVKTGNYELKYQYASSYWIAVRCDTCESAQSIS